MQSGLSAHNNFSLSLSDVSFSRPVMMVWSSNVCCGDPRDRVSRVASRIKCGGQKLKRPSSGHA